MRFIGNLNDLFDNLFGDFIVLANGLKLIKLND